MKKILVIGVLCIIMAGCAMYTNRSASQGPEKEITGRIIIQIDSFSALLNNQLLPAAENHNTNPEKLRQLFLESRLAYKKFEWAAEYFTPAITLRVNGPPVPEGEPNGIARQPAGLQVIEGCLYPQYDGGKRQEIVSQLRSLIANCTLYKNYYQQANISNWQVWDAAKQQVFRVLTLGIAGFDAPLAKSGLNESAASLRSVSNVLANYPADGDNGNLIPLFGKAIVYLQTDTGFDSFNRAVFITGYGNPLTAGINQKQQRLYLPQVRGSRLLKPNVATLFDEGAFDVWAYSAYPERGASPAQIALGKKLFNDPMLSGIGGRSCASCHQPNKAFTDGMAKNSSLEGGSLKRNTPTLFNAAFQPAQFADMRENTLEGQAKDVMESKEEMHGSIKVAIEKLSQDADYSRLFTASYPKSEKNGIGQQEITGAITAYVRTLSVLNSRFDSYMRGNAAAMNADEVSGFNLFMGKAKCGTCHYMPLFNGALPPSYEKMDAEIIGVPAGPNGSLLDADRGRYSITFAAPKRNPSFREFVIYQRPRRANHRN